VFLEFPNNYDDLYLILRLPIRSSIATDYAGVEGFSTDLDEYNLLGPRPGVTQIYGKWTRNMNTTAR
jgi:hypothetical protein